MSRTQYPAVGYVLATESSASTPSTPYATILVHGQSLDLNVNALKNETLHVGDTVVVDEGPKGVVVSGRAPELLIGDVVQVHCPRGDERTWVQAPVRTLSGDGYVVLNGRFKGQIHAGQWVLIDKTHSIILEILADS